MTTWKSNVKKLTFLGDRGRWGSTSDRRRCFGGFIIQGCLCFFPTLFRSLHLSLRRVVLLHCALLSLYFLLLLLLHRVARFFVEIATVHRIALMLPPLFRCNNITGVHCSCEGGRTPLPRPRSCCSHSTHSFDRTSMHFASTHMGRFSVGGLLLLLLHHDTAASISVSITCLTSPARGAFHCLGHRG